MIVSVQVEIQSSPGRIYMMMAVLAWLDRFYSFSNSTQHPSSHVVHYQNIGDSSFSYHHLVSLIKLSYWFPTGHLGRLMLGVFKKLRIILKDYGEHFLSKCLSLTNLG
jgi:hypothetical protein